MKKKVLAIMSALIVLSMSSITVFAASPTVGTTEKTVETQVATTSVVSTKEPATYAAATTVSEGYTVKEVSDAILQSTAVAVQNEVLNDVAKIGKTIGNTSLVSAATDSSKKVEATILSVVEVEAVKNASEKHVVTLKIADITEKDAIVVLHYTGSAWEIISPSEVATGSVTFETASLSPVTVVKLAVTDTVAAPRTGENIPMMAIFMLAGVAGVVVCTRKYLA